MFFLRSGLINRKTVCSGLIQCQRRMSPLTNQLDKPWMAPSLQGTGVARTKDSEALSGSVLAGKRGTQSFSLSLNVQFCRAYEIYNDWVYPCVGKLILHLQAEILWIYIKFPDSSSPCVCMCVCMCMTTYT